GGKGSQLTIETSDITLLSDDLTRVVTAIKLSRKTLNVIKQNTGFALLVVLGLVLSAFFGIIGLAIGVIGHEASALIVVANSMRLIRRKEKERETHHDGDDSCGCPVEEHDHEGDEEPSSCSVDDNECGCSH
ncbi:MAG: cation-translocating P-type ATPase, partial [Thermoplasmata archaeon]|nr:cation-translocating P-type ATPase [Thermoplasmata archaeon]